MLECHYIVLTVQFPEVEETEDGEGEKPAPIKYLDSVGFAGEELILKLTEMGLATSWLDDNFNKESILDFVHLEENEKISL